MDERTRRIGQNEALFREVNERVKDLNETFDLVLDERMLVCECGRETCIEQIAMTAEDYEAVRAASDQFVVIPGHEELGAEDVVGRGDGFVVVKKRPGEPTALAEELDPRT